MDIDDMSDPSAEEYTAFAVEAVDRSEHTTDPRETLELLARAQAWAMLAVAALLGDLRDVLAARRAAGQP